VDRRDTQKTQHGIETWNLRADLFNTDVETLRKPSTGLKRHSAGLIAVVGSVETLRKPSTGLKHDFEAVTTEPRVETLRKPSTGLKPGGQRGSRTDYVETLRKPSTGLKQLTTTPNIIS